MEKLGNYISGNWITGDGDGSALYNSVTGEVIVTASSKGFSSFSRKTTFATSCRHPVFHGQLYL